MAKKLTLAEAADQYEQARKAIAGLKPLMDDAAEVLVAYFDRTEKGAYKDRIGWTWSGGGLILNQSKAKKQLVLDGHQLADFQKRSRRSRSLTLLK